MIDRRRHPVRHPGTARASRDDDTRAREAVAARVRAHLAPTLASVRAGAPVTPEPRCLLGAALGQRLQELSGDSARLRHLVSVLSLGWEIQARGVSILCRHPGTVS